MEHADAGVHTVLADVERPAEHDPFADHPERVLTERHTRATSETVPRARVPATAAPALPELTGRSVAEGTDLVEDIQDDSVEDIDDVDDVDEADEADEAETEDLEDLGGSAGRSALAQVIDLGMGDLLGEAMEWQERALCAQTDPEAFFPEKGGSTREAKRICSGCEVRAECLEYALENDERFGIWGGMSERERRKQRRRAV
ncbi:WhiB family transcriptional regulator [Frankia sp. BMG5.23]|uniref:WhiB family transcriptional regulator n=1 Tax=Frankia sp. BMG5.23 TaxID=683305 RepID=UPI0004617B9D|nr:transcription factor WhiB [Frankia sp. BMG5.23]